MKVGKASRRKAQRKSGSGLVGRRERKIARDLQWRGERIGRSLEDLTNAASLLDDAGLITRMIADSNIRMMRCGALGKDLGQRAGEALKMVPVSTIALAQIEQRRNLHPNDYRGSLANQLGWGLDSIQQAVRLLLCGQLVGASLIARSQFERWTENLAFNRDMRRTEDEPFGAYAERVWARWSGSSFWSGIRAGELELRGRIMRPMDTYSALTSVIHGEISPGLAGFLGDGVTGDPPAEYMSLVERVVDALIMSNERIDSLLVNRGFEVRRRSALSSPEALIEILRERRPPLDVSAPLLWPLDEKIYEGETFVEAHMLGEKFRAVMRKERPEGRLYNNFEMSLLGFAEYRLRCMEVANEAFAQEASYNRNGLDFSIIRNTGFQLSLVSEMAGILSRIKEVPPEVSYAAATLSSALRSAHWLWLEDDNRAMALVRVCLEQAARLRVWRRRPDRAAVLERGATPGRWLERAGWKRLRPLNLALGELVHFRPDVKWEAAVQLLAEINRVTGIEVPDDFIAAEDVYVATTARGEALMAVMRLAAAEVALHVSAQSGPLGASFTRILSDAIGVEPHLSDRELEYVRLSESLASYCFPEDDEWILASDHDQVPDTWR